ncbi:hypothetical protein MMC30_009257 [Trapelia coarctata]|nr:hypothetical protein [Trapelia coarctata]
MSTRDTLFEFLCHNDHGLNETLDFVHPIPSSLITTTGHSDPSYATHFVGIIGPILQLHAPACLAASCTKCEVCGSPTVKVLQTPMSYLHLVENPLVACQVTAVCDKPNCEMMARRNIQEAQMEAQREVGGGMAPGMGREVMLCGTCGQMDDVKKCKGCGVVAYCGKECQKKDWKTHKPFCGSQTK